MHIVGSQINKVLNAIINVGLTARRAGSREGLRGWEIPPTVHRCGPQIDLQKDGRLGNFANETLKEQFPTFMAVHISWGNSRNSLRFSRTGCLTNYVMAGVGWTFPSGLVRITGVIDGTFAEIYAEWIL